MNDDQLVAALPGLLDRHWDRTATTVRPLGGGMNSCTALVIIGDDRFAAKWVPGPASNGLRAGAEIARRLADHELIAGPPLPTSSGDLVAGLDGGSLALLEFVDGTPLTGDAGDQPIIAEALAAAHRALGSRQRKAPFFDWLGDRPQVTDVADWVLPSIKVVSDEYRGLPPITWGTLHTDPTPDAFLHDVRTGRIGIIDWTGACEGPVLYDIASAVMYLGGARSAQRFLQTYAATGVLPTVELHDHLTTFSRFRAIVQADYFARRILDDDLTGIEDRSENQKGLNDARNMLTDLGVLDRL